MQNLIKFDQLAGIDYCSGSGTYTMISCSVQSRIAQRASSVFVETESFALRRRIVELLM